MKMPNEWKEKHLKDILDVFPQNGFSPQCVDYETGRFVLGLGNLTDYGLVYNELKNVPAEETRINQFQLQSGDFLISRSNTPDKVGRVGVFRNEVNNCFYPDLMMRFRINEKVANINFIEKVLTFPETQKYYQKCSAGSSSSMVKINNLTVQKTPILLPPLPEQKAIADLLSTWDSAIEKTEGLIAAKEKRFQWLLDELIGQAKDYKKVKFGSFLKESRIPDTENDPRQRLSVRLHLKGIEVRDYRGTESEGSTSYFKRKAGQFVYGKQNVFKGSVGIVPTELDGYSSTQDIPAFDISEKVCAEWLLFLFSYPNFYKKLELYASGSGSKRLHPKELFQMKISLPPIARQYEIAKVIGAAQKEIDILKSLAEKYKTQKRGLMQKLLTGEWRVKVA
jgi:type I restriction enzyme S subunit